MSKIINSDTEDSGMEPSTSESNTSGKSSDSQKVENDDIKTIHFGNKEFQMKRCDRFSSEKVIVAIENKLYELLSKKESIEEKEKFTTVNIIEESKNVDYQKCDIEQQPFLTFYENISNAVIKNKKDNLDLNENKLQADTIRNYLKTSQEEWNRLIREAVNIRLMLMFDELTIEEIAKDLKEKMTDEFISLIDKTNHNITLHDITKHIPKIVSSLIETIMFDYLQMKIIEHYASNMKNCELAPMLKFEKKKKELMEEEKLEMEKRKSDMVLMQLKNMGSSPNRASFAEELFAFMKMKGTPIIELPKFDSTRLDLYLLYRQVMVRGGYVQVTDENLWNNVMTNIGKPFGADYGPEQLKQLYEKYLYPFECAKNNPERLKKIIDSTIKHPNFEEIITQCYYKNKPKQSENKSTRDYYLSPVSIFNLSNNLLNQSKRPFLSTSLREKNEELCVGNASTKDRPLSFSEIIRQVDKSKCKLPSDLVQPKNNSPVSPTVQAEKSEMKTETKSEEESKFCSPGTSSEEKPEIETESEAKKFSMICYSTVLDEINLHVESETELELKRERELISKIALSDKKQRNKSTICNYNTVDVLAVISILISSFFLFIIYQSQISFSDFIDIF